MNSPSDIPGNKRVRSALSQIKVHGKSASDLRSEVVNLTLEQDLTIHEVADLVDALEACTGLKIWYWS